MTKVVEPQFIESTAHREYWRSRWLRSATSVRRCLR